MPGFGRRAFLGGLTAGAALLVFGTLLLLTQPLIWLIDATHHLTGE